MYKALQHKFGFFNDENRDLRDLLLGTGCASAASIEGRPVHGSLRCTLAHALGGHLTRRAACAGTPSWWKQAPWMATGAMVRTAAGTTGWASCSYFCGASCASIINHHDPTLARNRRRPVRMAAAAVATTLVVAPGRRPLAVDSAGHASERDDATGRVLSKVPAAMLRACHGFL